MSKTFGRAVTMALILTASTARADLVTFGAWSLPTAVPDQGTPFYNGLSWDCAECGVSWRIGSFEYLHAADDPSEPAAFAWHGPLAFTELGGTSDYLGDHIFRHERDGTFSLENGHGYTSTSTNGGALLLRLLTPQWIDYRLQFEDLPPWRTDRDYQDRGFAWRVNRLVTERHPPDPAPVPEPATLVLVGTGAVMLARRLRKRGASCRHALGCGSCRACRVVGALAARTSSLLSDRPSSGRSRRIRKLCSAVSWHQRAERHL